MLLRVNGQERELAARTTVGAYVAELGFSAERIAVELNGEIVAKADYGQVMLDEHDVVEIVSLVGGG